MSGECYKHQMVKLSGLCSCQQSVKLFMLFCLVFVRFFSMQSLKASSKASCSVSPASPELKMTVADPPEPGRGGATGGGGGGMGTEEESSLV